jgi:hypothetical protein
MWGSLGGKVRGVRAGPELVLGVLQQEHGFEPQEVSEVVLWGWTTYQQHNAVINMRRHAPPSLPVDYSHRPSSSSGATIDAPGA